MRDFDHRINEARPALMDTEGFWIYHDWVSDHEVFKLNLRIGEGEARQIQTFNQHTIITFGNGYHYDVEHIDRCPSCGVQIGFDETHHVGTCFNCSNSALEELFNV